MGRLRAPIVDRAVTPAPNHRMDRSTICSPFKYMISVGGVSRFAGAHPVRVEPVLQLGSHFFTTAFHASAAVKFQHAMLLLRSRI